jgi:hypothetical protein
LPYAFALIVLFLCATAFCAFSCPLRNVRDFSYGLDLCTISFLRDVISLAANGCVRGIPYLIRYDRPSNPCSLQSMFPEMSHRELLAGLTTLQTRHRMFGNAFPPVDGFCWGLWSCTRSAPRRCFQGLQCEKTGMGLLEGDLHLVRGQFMHFNLSEYEIFCHFEEGWGHGTFLDMEVGRRTRLDIVMNAASPKVLLFSFPVVRFSFVNFVSLSALYPMPSWRFSPSDSSCRIFH